MKKEKKMPNEEISSAEMTAYWRCKYPKISFDILSEKLASSDGIQKAHEFEIKYQYPLVGRKVSVRAGWFLQQATSRLLTGQYDSCISLGSGFSLLLYYIALAINKEKSTIKFIDVDLAEIVLLRNKRIESLSAKSLDQQILKKIEMLVFDLEVACREEKNFYDLFPSCKAPVFVIEGIIYFLSKKCVKWIFDNIYNYKNSIVIFDYWSAEELHYSNCFKRITNSLNNFIPEQIHGLINNNELNELCKGQLITDISLQEIENTFSKKNLEPPQLINKEEFIPVKLAIAGQL